MKLKLLAGLFLSSLFTVSCEQVEMVEPKTIARPETGISNVSIITSFDSQRQNLFAEGRFEPNISTYFSKQVYTAHGLTMDNLIKRSGANSAKFELRKADGKLRSEILLPTETQSNRWYGMSVYLPSSAWATDMDPDAWDMITQWHANDDPGEPARTPPISLVVMKGQLKIVIYWATKSINTNATVSGKKVFELGPVEKDKWLDMVYHINFSENSDGVLEVWKNGKKVVDFRGPNSYNDLKLPYFKAGLYKRNWNSITKRIVYIDDIRAGIENATYNDVAPEVKITDTPPTVDTTTTVQQPLSLVLMNADTHQPIQTLTEGVILDLAALPTKNLNIQATSTTKIGSVAFDLTGTQITSTVQSGAPYSLFGDTGGKYLAWTPATGSYSLTANSYSAANATGTAGTPLTVNFQVINQTTPVDNSVPPSALLMINNDAETTTSGSVTLTIKATGATQMRFHDDNDGDIWGAWEPVAATKKWTLSAGDGPKWVKVQVRNAAGQESIISFDDITLKGL